MITHKRHFEINWPLKDDLNKSTGLSKLFKMGGKLPSSTMKSESTPNFWQRLANFWQINETREPDIYLTYQTSYIMNVNRGKVKYLFTVQLYFWKGYLSNLLETALLPRFFVFWVRDFKFWLLAYFFIFFNCAKFQQDWATLMINVFDKGHPFEFLVDYKYKKHQRGDP